MGDGAADGVVDKAFGARGAAAGRPYALWGSVSKMQPNLDHVLSCLYGRFEHKGVPWSVDAMAYSERMRTGLRQDVRPQREVRGSTGTGDGG